MKEPLTSPLPPAIDAYLLALRWGILAAIGIIHALGGFRPSPLPQSTTLLDPRLGLALLVVYNLPVTLYTLRERPIATRRPVGLILGDVLFALILMHFTGGYRSTLFLTLLIGIVELALVYPWRLAFPILVGVDTVQLIASSPLGPNVDALLVVNRFAALLLFGITAMIFGGNLRQEESERRQAIQRVAQERLLNRLFFQLGASEMNPERVLQAVLQGAKEAFQPTCAFILLYEEEALRMAASTVTLPQAKQKGNVLPIPRSKPPGCFEVHRGSAEWPPIAQSCPAQRLIGVPIHSPGQEPVGWLFLGDDGSSPLCPDEHRLLTTFAMEAGLAIRNAQLYARERAYAQELERFNEVRANFFSALAHELKTPLTVLKTLGPALERLPNLPPETRSEIVQSIQLNLERLEGLINALFESARLEAGAVVLHPQPLDVARRITRNLSAVRPLAEQKGLRILSQVPNGLALAWADPQRFDLILSNLLHNAVKYTPPEGTIAVSAEPSGGAVTICVDDSGPGISPEDRERVFNKFVTVAPGQTSVGIGLGLYIARELVHLHGGRIWVTDSPLGGSRFCFTLPATHSEAPPEAPHPSSAQEP